MVGMAENSTTRTVAVWDQVGLDGAVAAGWRVISLCGNRRYRLPAGKERVFHAFDAAHVVANTARLVLHDRSRAFAANSVVQAHDSSGVMATGSTKVYATDFALVAAHDRTEILLSGKAYAYRVRAPEVVILRLPFRPAGLHQEVAA